MPPTIARPTSDEYAPYYETYIRNSTETDVISMLVDQLRETPRLFRKITEETASRTNEPGKWSVKEIVGHLIDCERIMSYRALRFARNDATPLPGFEQDPYMLAANFNERSFAGLVDEYEHVRQATIDLFKSISTDACLRRGTADDKPVSVRALAWIIACHERHHIKILRERYL
jgi:hypothetical protein